MEMQFYPPGWVPYELSFASCDATHWCAALNIDSLSENQNTGEFNNPACEAAVGDEYVNFAFITKNGVAHAPASPLLATIATFTPNPATDLFMNPGDTLVVTLQDTSNGLQVVIDDVTTGQTGLMTASAANGFGEVLFDPKGNNCKPKTHNIPTNFHPTYATSSEHTRVPWTAHGYNIAFSDEIGHFEYCNAVASEGGSCIQDGVHDLDTTLDGAEDDNFCFDAAASSNIQIGGCTDSDSDFDGVPYQLVWPGTSNSASMDRSLHPQPVRFSSPLFKDNQGSTASFSRVAFETDLPRIEFDTKPLCQRHISNPADSNPGSGCVNPPVGASFYPIFTTTKSSKGSCLWQLGGANIPGTTNTFGGTSTAEYGSLLPLAYPAVGGPTFRYNDFRQVLSTNPCPQ